MLIFLDQYKQQNTPWPACTTDHRDSQKPWHGSSVTGYYSHPQGFPRLFAITQQLNLGANQWGSLQQLYYSRLQDILCCLWRKNGRISTNMILISLSQYFLALLQITCAYILWILSKVIKIKKWLRIWQNRNRDLVMKGQIFDSSNWKPNKKGCICLGCSCAGFYEESKREK